MKKASHILGDNLIRAFKESSRSANDVAAKTDVGQTTISAWLRKARDKDPDFNPRLDQLQAVAEELGYSIADLFAENLGRTAPTDAEHDAAGEARPPDLALSPEASHIVNRLAHVDRAGSASPALLHALAAVLDLASPPASGDGYAGLDDLPAE